VCVVKVYEGGGLPKGNLYVVGYLGEEKIFKTKVKKKTTDPKWNDEFKMYCPPPPPPNFFFFLLLCF